MDMPSSINRDRFVRETIDGETIIMDTVSGRLLLLRETAPLVLTMLDSGTPQKSVLEEVSNRYGTEAETQTRNFVAKLAELGVIVTEGAVDSDRNAKAVGAVNWPSAFAPPVVEVYDDIADIITMDPIHDVDANSGWPRAAASSRE
jgi:hypothetical protein